jgi:decaprenylphospho-beta-D-ribofuranose 2-oxidase
MYRWGYRHDEYVDDLEGFTFFMDGNARAKRAGKRFGFSMRNVQQTFVVPFNAEAEDGWDEAQKSLAAWLETANELLTAKGLRPTLHDVLFLPGDDAFLLSASSNLAGFAVSYAFETSNRSTIKRATEAFEELSDVLWERFGGRVYLVKNVFASKETLATMYEANADHFFELKRELDPDGILRNDFLERTFGELL